MYVDGATIIRLECNLVANTIDLLKNADIDN
nr:MAG TPA: hypothetical protein [Caudoviricetes sp.]